MDVYRGADKVAEFESYDELRVGENKPAFMYEGNELVYPNPVKDGLVLWYDFSGRTNTDSQRGIAEDLSGNDNHGTLQNFNFTLESGYDKNGLLFDGVDDYIRVSKNKSHEVESLTIEVNFTLTANLSGRWEWLLMNGSNASSGTGYGMFFNTLGELAGSVSGRSFISSYTPSLGENVIATFVCEDGRAEIYVNGDNVYTSSTGLDAIPSSHDIGIGKATYYGSPLVPYHYNSVKLYSKALTPEEIAHNYAIEKDRFGIE